MQSGLLCRLVKRSRLHLARRRHLAGIGDLGGDVGRIELRGAVAHKGCSRSIAARHVERRTLGVRHSGSTRQRLDGERARVVGNLGGGIEGIEGHRALMSHVGLHVGRRNRTRCMSLEGSRAVAGKLRRDVHRAVDIELLDIKIGLRNRRTLCHRRLARHLHGAGTIDAALSHVENTGFSAGRGGVGELAAVDIQIRCLELGARVGQHTRSDGHVLGFNGALVLQGLLDIDGAVRSGNRASGFIDHGSVFIELGSNGGRLAVRDGARGFKGADRHRPRVGQRAGSIERTRCIERAGVRGGLLNIERAIHGHRAGGFVGDRAHTVKVGEGGGLLVDEFARCCRLLHRGDIHRALVGHLRGGVKFTLCEAGTRRNIHCAGGGQGTGTRDATGSLHIQDVNRCAGLRTVREFTRHIGRAELELGAVVGELALKVIGILHGHLARVCHIAHTRREGVGRERTGVRDDFSCRRTEDFDRPHLDFALGVVHDLRSFELGVTTDVARVGERLAGRELGVFIRLAEAVVRIGLVKGDAARFRNRDVVRSGNAGGLVDFPLKGLVGGESRVHEHAGNHGGKRRLGEGLNRGRLADDAARLRRSVCLRMRGGRFVHDHELAAHGVPYCFIDAIHFLTLFSN